MKSTGIIRRIDDLGRVVIPKEIRKSFKISEGDPVEIYVESDNIVLKRYDSMRTLNKEAKAICEALASVIELPIIISDLNSIVAFANVERLDYMTRNISKELKNVIKNREVYSTKNNTSIKILEEDLKDKYISEYIIPIVVDAYVVGSLIVFSKTNGRTILDSEIKQINLAIRFLEKIID